MKTISYTECRHSFAGYIDEVCNKCQGIIITRLDAPSVIILSLEEYQAMKETLSLLKSPKNAQMLFKAIKEIEDNQAERIELLKDED